MVVFLRLSQHTKLMSIRRLATLCTQLIQGRIFIKDGRMTYTWV